MSEEKSKLTRRGVAWAVAWIAALSCCFAVVYGAVTENMALLNLGLAPLVGALGSILTYFFTRPE